VAELSNNGQPPALQLAYQIREPALPDRWNHGLHLESLANLAHELRSPVQAMLGYLDMLRDDLGEAAYEHHRHLMERMSVNALDLAQTVENVMDFAVADSTAQPEDDEDIRIHELISELQPALQAANDSDRLEIKLDLDCAPTTFRMRRRAVKSILMNLVVNAIKFTRSGTVTITVRSAFTSERGPAIEIVVSDTGPGIDAAMVERAFMPCTQLSDTSARRHRGVGLGLAVVQRNVLALGARIVVKSPPGNGSTFIVTIPCVDRTAVQHRV
jgi:signal transduction histidine kinase